MRLLLASAVGVFIYSASVTAFPEELCPSFQTFCVGPLEGLYGCCSVPKAVCCSNGLQCCPTNMVCNLDAGTCDNQKSNIFSQLSLLRIQRIYTDPKNDSKSQEHVLSMPRFLKGLPTTQKSLLNAPMNFNKVDITYNGKNIVVNNQDLIVTTSQITVNRGAIHVRNGSFKSSHSLLQVTGAVTVSNGSFRTSNCIIYITGTVTVSNGNFVVESGKVIIKGRLITRNGHVENRGVLRVIN